MSHFKDFEFDLPSALLERLVLLFSEMTPGALNDETVEGVPEAQGVYQLFFQDELVYVGKTDADAGLKRRLLRHARKIRSRSNLTPESVAFKAVRVYVFTAMDLEDLLIKHYREHHHRLSWNLSGFGSNDPGRNRDRSRLKGDHFDSLYPIDLELPITHRLESFPVTVASLLRFMKDELAYTVRFQNAGGNSRRPHPDLEASVITLAATTNTVRELLRQAKIALGADWQITALRGYVIAYKESASYPHGEVIEA